MKRAAYDKQLIELQHELVRLQYWIQHHGKKLVLVFEGRDASGKGGLIKAITDRLNPRVTRVAALPKPTEREQTQWYFQRYVPYLPAAGEIVVFDRSWYNRAGVEHVMGFCTDQEYREFLRSCPEFERMLLRSDLHIVKYWLSVSREEQRRRFEDRVDDPTKRWKLSPMDLESLARFDNYSRAKDEMFVHTDIDECPWWVVEGDDKRSARLNCITHLLGLLPYQDVSPPAVKLPKAKPSGYERPPRDRNRYVPKPYG